ncbi:MAG TPA: nuclease-related domain-containing protein [Steroidobacteraceae bacterium]|nr:nuclease-related domain-containing protein [Steroidobacteraceae bacterium]
MSTDNLIVEVVIGVALSGLLTLGAFTGFRRWRHRRARRQIIKAVEEISSAALRDIVVPDGSGGHLHLDFLLRTGRGLLVVDLRDVAGVVFGGEHMREWAVMNGNKRSTFLNPLESLYDRVAAVRLLAGDVPVEGRIVFTDRGRFPKGRPPHVSRLGTLAAEFPTPEPGAVNAAADRFRQAWEEIVSQAEPSPLARR